jgi:hypothetical protein
MGTAQLIANRFRIDDLEHDLLGCGGMGAVKALDPHLVASREPGRFQRTGKSGRHCQCARQAEVPLCLTGEKMRVAHMGRY